MRLARFEDLEAELLARGLVAPEAAAGAYDVTICASIEFDPRETCHPTTVTVVVPAFEADFAVTAEPAALQMAPGASVSSTIRFPSP